jgi:hypothetical protein
LPNLVDGHYYSKMTICKLCSKNATFNVIGEKAQFCATHKSEDMVDVVNVKCECGKSQPRWNFQGLKARYCSTCKSDGMIEPNRKMCECGSVRPSFNFIGIKAAFCNQCKKEGMVNVNDKRCVCGKVTSPNYNYEGSKGEYCVECKLPDMVDVRNPRCPCGNRPNFNLPNIKRAEFCSQCKTDEMIDITHSKCIVCKETQPIFNYAGVKPPTHCSKCKLPSMVDSKHKLCNCLKSQPTYNLPGLRPEYCKECKTSEMIDSIHKLCKTPLCGLRVIDKYDGYCVRCFVYMFPDIPVARNYKTKEFAVAEYIKEQFPQITWYFDKQIQDGCSRRRPDAVLDLGYQVIIVEIDENQHMDYDCSCENKRIMQLSQDVGHRPIIFIRFNPDEYYVGEKRITSCWGINKSGICVVKKTHKKEWVQRLASLADQIYYWTSSENVTNKTVETIQLYYDTA